MAREAQERRIDRFFSGPGARADEWRALMEAAKAWSTGAADRAGFEQQLSQLAISGLSMAAQNASSKLPVNTVS